ncbi:MAG TPA: ammonium transporter [Candidatus Egerieimonas intestinavium]|uniref:Ammonium transporter n=1 Tax=Candidatus Egerieimonas intestinavium TaxID=2840777 RepID=A0A9D1EJI6_9FIRM|nr:ammonium transporter [Candidatus Egerieimonas intestinavium]
MTGEMLTAISEAVGTEVFGIWFLIGAAFVFFMQAGFAMVETGFTRAKNAGNIIMKNLMDFCIGTCVFIVLGFGILLGEDALGGFIGLPTLGIFTDYGNFDWSNFVFNLVFCATAATIVSGSMAERTKFLSYCVYSAVISAVVYPVEAHWIWGGGWLSQMGFHDFAGSCAIHMVGGLTAFIGAAMVGARIGKFSRDKNGKVTKVHAFPGHNLVIGSLGCFILWFGWYGFNGAAATTGPQLASIFMTTTIAPAVATVVCMIFTWIKYGKPDVSMCLNASLAGLVAITASCDVTDAAGSLIIGAVAGLLVVFGVWFCDYVVHVDDPVGAVAVHCANGLWGTIAVGLFATSSVPECSIDGLFYGGGFKQLSIQLTGAAAVLAWTAVTMFIVFKLIDMTIGLRVAEEEEIVGLDSKEHGLASAYAGFSIMDITEGGMVENENTDLGVSEYEKASEAQKAISVPVAGPVDTDSGIHKVVIIAKLSRYERLKTALNEVGVTGMTVTQVMGCGIQKGAGEKYRGVEMDVTVLPKVKVEVIIGNIPVDKVIETAKKTLYTGHVGDGKIFVYNVQKVVKVRTGEEDLAALRDVE